MSADDRCPSWIRVSTTDMDSYEGRYILGGKSTREWADYGRYFALLQLLARSPEGWVDVADDRRLKSLAADLAMTPKACREWLGVLVRGGVIDGEAYGEFGRVFVADIFNSVQAYQARAQSNRRNGARGGRPRAAGSDTPAQGGTET